MASTARWPPAWRALVPALLLSFSTPVLVLSDVLAEIADDIARSLRFTR